MDAMGFDAKVTYDTINYVVAAFESGIGLSLGRSPERTSSTSPNAISPRATRL